MGVRRRRGEHKGKEKGKGKGEKGKKEKKSKEKRERGGEEREREKMRRKSACSSSARRRSNGWNSLDQEEKSVYSTRATLQEVGILPTLVSFHPKGLFVKYGNASLF